MPRPANVREVRQTNRSAVASAILMAGETTRAHIADRCELSQASVTNIVSDLIRDGLVRELDPIPSGGGRPIAPVSVAPDGAHFIGADVGEQGVTVELFDLAMRPLDRVFRPIPTRSSTPRKVAGVVSKAIAGLRAAHPEVDATLVGVGLGLPGIVDSGADGRPTMYAQSLGWSPVRVDDVFSTADLPTFADNGAKTLATAELWRGAARGVTNGVVALLGRGVGVGVISGGRLLRGATSSAGEWGHTKVSLGGPVCACGARGCIEAYVGGSAIARRWSEAGGPGGTGNDAEVMVPQLLAAAADGDDTARRVLDETVEILGIGLSNLVNLFNPEQIVVGGWVGLQLMETCAAQLDEQVRRHALAKPAERYRLDACLIGGDAVALGAALLPLEHLVAGTLPPPKRPA